MQVGKFLKNIKRAGQNRRCRGDFFFKINKGADPNKGRGDFFLKINKHACTSIRHTRVHTLCSCAECAECATLKIGMS